MGWDDFTSIAQSAGIGVLGELVQYTPHDGAQFDVRAHFYEEGIDVDVEGEVRDVQDTRPEVHVRLTPAAPDGLGGRMPEKGDLVTARGGDYTVEEWEPDGEGFVAVKLYEAD